MGWWETSSRQWRMAIVAQLGGGAVLGAGGFFIQFTAPELGRRKPAFLAIAGGAAVGGSIGSGLGIPYSEVIRRIINPDAIPTPPQDLIFSPLAGEFALRDIQGAQFSITQIGASAAVVGAQIVSVECRQWRFFGLGGQRTWFVTDHQVPTDLPSLGRALADTPQIQGGLGLVALGFTGSIWYVG